MSENHIETSQEEPEHLSAKEKPLDTLGGGVESVRGFFLKRKRNKKLVA